MSGPLEILGRTEGPDLEFKEAEALRRPEIIGREVVAMLNAGGGSVWIGVREEESVAVELQSIEDPVRARSRLLDYLVDAVEPDLDDEVRVEPHTLDRDRAILVITVRPGYQGKRPYALLRRRTRLFAKRVESRLRPMTREELAAAFRQPDEKTADASRLQAQERLFEDRESTLGSGASQMWLRIQPVDDLEVDVQSPDLMVLLKEARRSGNRPLGWTAMNPLREPGLRKGRLVQGDLETFRTEIHHDGSIRFTTPLERLHWKGPEREIWPYALIEYPVSVFRLARETYAQIGMPDGSRILADLALFGVRGWHLRPHSPRAFGYTIEDTSEPVLDADLVWDKPRTFAWSDLRENPDACAYPLIRRVYEAFGLEEDRIPAEFDPGTRRLVIPD